MCSVHVQFGNTAPKLHARHSRTERTFHAGCSSNMKEKLCTTSVLELAFSCASLMHVIHPDATIPNLQSTCMQES